MRPLPPHYRSLDDIEAATNRLRLDSIITIPGDLLEDRVVPARPLVMKTAEEIATKLLFPAKEPTLAHQEWVANFGIDELARDFPTKKRAVCVPFQEADGWSIYGIVAGVGEFDWGFTTLAVGYHDFSAEYDVEHFLRLGTLHLALLNEGESTWKWRDGMLSGGVVARVIDSREYGTRTGVRVVSRRLLDETLERYVSKLKAIGLSADNEDTRFAREWDRAHPRDLVHGYSFEELDAPTAEAEALLMMKWSAMKRQRDAVKDHAVAKAEIALAFNRGTIQKGTYHLPDIRMIATVEPPRARHMRVPFVRFLKEGT